MSTLSSVVDVDDRIHAADTLVSDEALALSMRPNVFISDVKTRLLKDLQFKTGSRIRMSSMWFTRSHDKVACAIKITALWAPDPTLGVLLVGGPLDGTIRGIRRFRDTPWPPQDFTVPYQPAELVPMIESQYPSPYLSVSVQHLRYDRAGIDKISDMWVYKFHETGV